MKLLAMLRLHDPYFRSVTHRLSNRSAHSLNKFWFISNIGFQSSHLNWASRTKDLGSLKSICTLRGVRYTQVMFLGHKWLTPHVTSLSFFLGLPSIQPLHRHSGWVSLSGQDLWMDGCVCVCLYGSVWQCPIPGGRASFLSSILAFGFVCVWPKLSEHRYPSDGV